MTRDASKAFLAPDWSFTGDQHWISTSYDFAVASHFAGSGGVIWAIHIMQGTRALFASGIEESSVRWRDQHHEREIMLFVHGKKFQQRYRKRVRLGALRKAKVTVAVVEMVDAKPLRWWR